MPTFDNRVCREAPVLIFNLHPHARAPARLTASRPDRRIQFNLPEEWIGAARFCHGHGT